MTETIKVLSVRQPWAYLICAGFKNIENRTWKTDYRGRLYIHAGKSFDWNALNYLEWNHLIPYEYYRLVHIYFGIKDRRIVRHQEDFGAIIGSVDLTGCIQNSRSIWAQSGLFHWELHDPLELSPIPLKGQLGIFEVKYEILQVNP
jgi:hypothetical protein